MDWRLDTPAHKRDVAAWRLAGACQMIASGNEAGVEATVTLAVLRKAVAEFNDEIAAIDAAEGDA